MEEKKTFPADVVLALPTKLEKRFAHQVPQSIFPEPQERCTVPCER
jgi:hypothetical protein